MRNEPEPQAGSRMRSSAACFGVLPSSSLPTVFFDDVVDDVGRRVVDAAGLLDLGLVLDLGLMAGREADHLAEELLVDLPEDVGRQHRELVGALGVVEALEDVLERLVVDREAGVSASGASARPLLVGEVEEAGVVALVGLAEELAQARVDVLRRSASACRRP